MNDTTTLYLIWLPCFVIALLDFIWFMSLPKRKKKHNDATAAGIFFLGFMVSFFTWALWEVYKQEGWSALKLKIADKTLFAVFGIALGAVIALAIIGTFAVLATNQGKKK